MRVPIGHFGSQCCDVSAIEVRADRELAQTQLTTQQLREELDVIKSNGFSAVSESAQQSRPA